MIHDYRPVNYMIIPNIKYIKKYTIYFYKSHVNGR